MIGMWAIPYVRAVGFSSGILGPYVKRLTCVQRSKLENTISKGR